MDDATFSLPVEGRNNGNADAYIEEANRLHLHPHRSAMQGKTVTVRVRFADDADNEDILTIAGTDTMATTKPVAAPGTRKSSSRCRSAGRLLGSPGHRRRLRHYRLQGAVDRERRQLGHAGRRIGGDGVRDHRRPGRDCPTGWSTAYGFWPPTAWMTARPPLGRQAPPGKPTRRKWPDPGWPELHAQGRCTTRPWTRVSAADGFLRCPGSLHVR